MMDIAQAKIVVHQLVHRRDRIAGETLQVCSVSFCQYIISVDFANFLCLAGIFQKYLMYTA